MATWHQQKAFRRNPIRFDHDTEWSVVIDPPNQMRAIVRFSDKAMASAYADKVAHSFILPPRSASNASG